MGTAVLVTGRTGEMSAQLKPGVEFLPVNDHVDLV
jgi:hypothetical protein